MNDFIKMLKENKKLSYAVNVWEAYILQIQKKKICL
jgi:hypothetical protein